MSVFSRAFSRRKPLQPAYIVRLQDAKALTPRVDRLRADVMFLHYARDRIAIHLARAGSFPVTDDHMQAAREC